VFSSASSFLSAALSLSTGTPYSLSPSCCRTGIWPPEWQEVLRPVFDGLWNAYGYPRCSDLFDDDGRWTGLPAAWT
jgi:hypothetical protein